MANNSSAGARIALWSAAIIIGLAFVAIIGVGVFARIMYAGFYAQAQDEFSIPGQSEGFVCQALDYYDKGKAWFFSGYSTKDDASPVYRVNSKVRAVSFHVKDADGMTYKDHGSGITTTDQHAFLACENGYLVFDADDFMNAREGDYVQAIGKVALPFDPAFLNIENGTLYAGTFHKIPEYPAPVEHHLVTPDGYENASIMLGYPADEDAEYEFSTQASVAYSLPDMVQGACVLPNGNVVLSTSWGIHSSYINTYKVVEGEAHEMFQTGGRGVPLHYLIKSTLIASIKAPPMVEGIEYHDGRVWISDESASDKYVFGKLYGAGQVYSIEM